MTTTRQAQGARLNVEKASPARQRRTLLNPPNAPRRNLGPNASTARMRGGSPGRPVDDRTRRQLYDGAKKRNIPGGSRTGKVEWLPRWVSSWT
jgi:hypothetical protein